MVLIGLVIVQVDGGKEEGNAIVHATLRDVLLTGPRHDIGACLCNRSDFHTKSLFTIPATSHLLQVLSKL